MDKKQKQQIILLRIQGLSYKEIAKKVNISYNTISAFCKRNRIEKDTLLCKLCKTPINNISGQKPKKFCSDKCRTSWWNTHQKEVQRKAVYQFHCAYCGSDFTAYGNSKRKYCTHTCYIKARYGRRGGCDEQR